MGGNTPSECAVLCAQAVEDLILFHGPETVAAFIGETISISGGTAIPGDEYWPMIREICDRYGVLLIADEVINGFGRTGKMFAIEHWDIVPDILTVAKGIISSYLPLAATVVKKEVADHFAGKDNLLTHVITFSGHPVAAAAALKNIEIIENEGLVENSAETGAYFVDQLSALKEDHPTINNVRGLGLLLTVELSSDKESSAPFDPDVKIASRLNDQFKENGLIFRVRNETLNIGPPLCITRDEVNRIVNAIDRSLGAIESDLGISNN
jgi:adenosylmethionine-8-amino-7-oxononanoate aminotransferase